MFAKYTKEQYRALDPDALDARRAEIDAELTGGDTPITEMREEVRMFNEEKERRSMAADLRMAQTRAALGAAPIVASTAAVAAAAEVDANDTPEYRKAFMDYCTRGVKFTRSEGGEIVSGPTVTANVSPQVPSTMQKEIIQKMEEYGTIYNEVRKLSVQGGIWFRVVDIEPEASWIGETETADYQGVKNEDKISFSFFELECRMSQTLLAQAVTYADFQALFVPAVAKAMVKAIEKAILSGDKTKQPTGLLTDTRITNVVEMSAAEFADWKKWRSEFKAKIPYAYRGTGSIYMAQSSFDCYVETMSDDQNAPVSIDYNPVTGVEQSRLAGIEVKQLPEGYLPDFDSAAVGDVVAFYGDLNNYGLNTQPGMPLTTVRWIDHETNTEKMKSLVALDGKVLDPYGFVLIKKKASA